MAGGLRSLTLIGVTNSFSFDYCAIQPYLSNRVPGRELRIVERSGLQIHCSCLTAFYRKYGEFIALIVVLPCVVIAQLHMYGLHTTVNSELLQRSVQYSPFFMTRSTLKEAVRLGNTKGIIAECHYLSKSTHLVYMMQFCE